MNQYWILILITCVFRSYFLIRYKLFVNAIHMRVTHLNGIRALESALRNGSFRAAADELGVTTAAVGQQIRTLENYLGTRLFERTAAGARPSSSARAIAPRLSASLATIEDVVNQLKQRPPENRLALTLPSSFAENWFSERLPEFYRLNSEIDLRLDASNRMVDLLAEDFDFAIRYSSPGPESYDEVELFGDFVVPVCTPEFAKRYRISKQQRSLAGVPLIHLGERTPDPDWADWASWGAAFDFDTQTLTHGIRLNEYNSGIQTAIQGQGLVLCGIAEAFRAIQEGLLTTPFGARLNCPGGYRYRLVSVSGRARSGLHYRFRIWMGQTAARFRGEVAEYISRS